MAFPPTYKYQPGTDSYDRRPEKKLRCPAYCDRILWKVRNSPNCVTALSYVSSTLNPSDHKPVLAVFDVTVREVVAEKERRVYSELAKKLDAAKRDGAVSVEINGTRVELVDVRYEVSARSYGTTRMSFQANAILTRSSPGAPLGLETLAARSPTGTSRLSWRRARYASAGCLFPSLAVRPRLSHY